MRLKTNVSINPFSNDIQITRIRWIFRLNAIDSIQIIIAEIVLNSHLGMNELNSNEIPIVALLKRKRKIDR